MGDDLRKMFDAGDETVLPPVVAAIAYSAHAYGVSFNNKAVVVIGKGRLVGAPATVWATRQGGKVVSLSNLDTKEPHLQTADIIILGAGVPALVSPSMIKNGVVIFDAGTSEEEGKLAGDADPSCASVASLITPVPGGIGPIAVALLFSNLYTLGARKDALSID
jgi:methylenetetrahydrofolate dehydrogenase (NADP+)/methenyltetrahydrofolate cyclohydrolase